MHGVLSKYCRFYQNSAVAVAIVIMSAAAVEEIDDPVELMLRKTGCIELHYKVQECIAETGDWRRCQDVVKEFKECMKTYADQQTKKYSNAK